ncbi:MAG: restriction endonuclease subunit S [Flavobacterium sp.]|uniref:restriction endonuclease subunit S n=1 Tax=Flavobacterium sp. TaxID=239 RepID=UPI0022C2255F|nr:restriction endonuclease subunit S [Flavobacterium sp.]MCZ8330660.1 restriction endonuclease subunit S [Flavobacterium sp.]
MTKNNNILPQGWQTKSLGQIGTFFKGKGIAKAEIVETGKPCIRYGQIYSEYNYFVEEFKSFIDETSAKNSEPIFKNDLLFAGSGETLADIGKCVAYIKEEEAYAGGDIVILRPNSEDAHYLGYLFNADEFKKQTYKLGQGHSVVHIYSSSLKNVKVTLPPLPEQQKIAKILATWDKAIKLQQELIYNKKQYKKAVMKKLLTGEVRFKGFSEKWQEYHLGFLGNTYSGLSGKSKEDFGIGLPYIPYKNIYGNPSIDITYMDYVNIKPIENQNQVIYGDIFFTVSSETPDEVGMSSVLLDKSIEELYLNSFCFGFRLNDFKTLLPEFASHYFRGDKFRFEMLKAAQGATRFNLSKSNVTKLKIVIPSVAEQLKIASFLSGIDKETKALECELLYFQKQKQGLMQQLLTGKIRVKN